MPDRIYVTYTPTQVRGTFHTANHYERTDPTGAVIKHVVIEAGPEAEGTSDKASGLVEEPFRTGNNLSSLKRIAARVRGWDQEKDLNKPSETIAEGEDLSRNLELMQNYAHDVNRAGYPY